MEGDTETHDSFDVVIIAPDGINMHWQVMGHMPLLRWFTMDLETIGSKILCHRISLGDRHNNNLLIKESSNCD